MGVVTADEIKRAAALWRQGLRAGQIAHELGRPERTVFNWLTALREGRDPAQRPPPISTEIRRRVLRMLDEGQSKRAIVRETGVSATSVLRIRDAGWSAVHNPPRQGPPMLDARERQSCEQARTFHELTRKWARRATQ